MSHIHFCENCSMTATKKCSRCMTTRYCGIECQREDWKSHQGLCNATVQDTVERSLFALIAVRLNKHNLPYEHFKGFMKNQSYRYEKRTIQQWMEDWMSGWHTEERERKEMLRGMFAKNGLSWSVDAFPMYMTWAEGRAGNRFEKMTEFVKSVQALF